MQLFSNPGHSIYTLFVLGLIAFLALPLKAGAATDSARPYNILQLGEDFIPLSISDNGLILGKEVSTNTLKTKQVLYGTAPTVIDKNSLGTNNEALQINDNSWVVGHSKATPPLQTSATLWSNGLLSTELQQFANLIKAGAINSFNEIVGTRLIDGLYRRPFHYDFYSGKLTTLGTLGGSDGWAHNTNENGYVVGSSFDTEGNTLAFRYQSKIETLTAVGTLEGYSNSEGWRINDNQDVIGWAYNNTRDQVGKRGFYNTIKGNLANLGTISKDTDSIARGINNSGLIVGQSIRADGDGRAFRFDATDSEVMIVVADPANPNTVYAHSTTGAGIMKSTDRGTNWITINNGLSDLHVNSLIFHPFERDTLYAGTNKGAFISENRGNTWKSISLELEKDRINILYLNFEDNKGGNPIIFAGADAGIYYSLNNGLNWTLSTSSVGFKTYNLVSSPKNPDFIYAATSKGVYSSTDRGVFWSRQNGQDNTKLLSQTVSSIVIDPNDPDTLYVGTLGGGVFKTDLRAGSLQWQVINDNTLVNLNIYTLLFYDNNGVSQLFAGSTGGLYKREIGSTAWDKASNFGNRGAYSLSITSNGSSTYLYASSFDGDIFRSESINGTPTLASNWASITRGAALADIYTINTIKKDNNDPLSETHILAGASNGFFKRSYKSLDTQDWLAPASGASGMKITTVVYDPRTTPYTLWAGSSDRGIMRSIDDGDTWTFNNDGLDNWNISALEIDTTPTIPMLFAGTMAGVYRSDDGGIHWSKASTGLNNMPVYSLLLDTSVTPAILYAGTKKGVYRSSDFGHFWIAMNNGISDKEIVALKRISNGNLLAGSISGGLFISSDNAQSWDATNGTSKLPVFDLDEDPFMANTLLVATTKGLHKIECSTTCTWSPTVFLADNLVMAVRFDPDNANHIYAGTEGGGMQASSNLGASWQAANSGITTMTNRMEVLSNMLEPAIESSRWNLQDAVDINNNGEIIGWGYRDNNDDGLFDGTYGYLLLPTIGGAEVDLVVTQTTQPETVKQGVPFNYHIAITNIGRNTEVNARLIDWLPPDIIFRVVSTSTTKNDGTCEKRPENIIRCDLKNIAPGDTVYVNIFMESPYRDVQIHNIARVSGDGRDVDMSNNVTVSNNTISIDRCFIATAAYGSFLDPHVTALRAFRDEYLLTNRWGREFVAFYYRHSPPIANLISESVVLRSVTRLLLAPIIYAVLYPVITLILITLLASGLIYYRQRRRQLSLTI